MSNKVMAGTGVGLAALVIGFLVGSQPGCGSSSGNAQSVCNQVCDKAASCGLGTNAAQCKQDCASLHCTNSSAMTSAGQQCVAKSDCAQFATCVVAIPDCIEVSTGAGGSSGTGGNGGGGSGAGGSGSGNGGSSGADAGLPTGCAACTKAEACCAALGDGGDCSGIAAQCNAATGTNKDDAIAGCQAILAVAGILGTPPAACR